MDAAKTILMCAAVAGCAGMTPAAMHDRVAGHWTGLLDHGGWVQPLALEIDDVKGSWRGEWRPGPGGSSEPLHRMDVDGRAVRFETDKLLFVGHLQGSALVGTVSRKDTNAAEGKFFVTHDEMAYEPGSEPAFPYVR